MPYKIVTYMLIDPEEEILFETKEEAKKEKEQLEFLQPENIYKIVAVKKETATKFIRENGNCPECFAELVHDVGSISCHLCGYSECA